MTPAASTADETSHAGSYGWWRVSTISVSLSGSRNPACPMSSFRQISS
jgi:hypothetical protein